jgi:hypothetical protein
MVHGTNHRFHCPVLNQNAVHPFPIRNGKLKILCRPQTFPPGDGHPFVIGDFRVQEFADRVGGLKEFFHVPVK